MICPGCIKCCVNEQQACPDDPPARHCPVCTHGWHGTEVCGKTGEAPNGAEYVCRCHGELMSDPKRRMET